MTDFLCMSIHAGTQEYFPCEDGFGIAALADAGQTELRVLLHRDEYVARVQAT